MAGENICGVLRPSDKELVRRAMQNLCAPVGTTYQLRWVSVKDVFAVGSTTAVHLCREFGYDPDESLSGSMCDMCLLDEDESDFDHSPYCSHCGAMKKDACSCGPIPDND